jgi:phosphotransferase system enzyme I (PtsI)
LDFLDTHIMMLKDPEFAERVERKLRDSKENVEWILHLVIQEMVDRLGTSTDEYLRERASDFQDVAKRVLGHLMYRDRFVLSDLDEDVILVTHDLLPSDAVAMNKRRIRAMAMDAGGRTSHTAIIARSFEIPAVLGLSNVSRMACTGDQMIVDGNRGIVVLAPDDATSRRYRAIEQEWHEREVRLMGLNDLPAETRDGKLITLKGNIEVPEEVDSLFAHGADGVGLYRSEFLFLKPGQLPSEEEQFRAYRSVLEAMGEKPVTIRTLDIGGDKVVPELEDIGERNPILGWRAIRFCLSNLELFRTQLRALFRASVCGNLEIMFPMISGIEELGRTMEVVEEVRSDLKGEGIPVAEEIPFGIMIEVPSAAMTSDILARRSDFFSIGTNDLIQYTLAVDRGNEKIAYLYEPFHPGVLRLLQMVIDNAHANGISVGMCGEMAGDPSAAIILLGLGLDEFSMSAFTIPEVKRIIRSVTLAEAQEVVGTVMDMKSYHDIDEYVRELMEDRFDVRVY